MTVASPALVAPVGWHRATSIGAFVPWLGPEPSTLRPVPRRLDPSRIRAWHGALPLRALAMVVESATRWTYPELRQPGPPRTEPVISPPSRDFDQFFLDHYDDITRSLGAAFGDDERAAEAVQDAFMRAYGRWRSVRRMDSPAAWVRRVAINRLRDLHRKAERQARAERRAVEQAPGALAPTAGDIVDMLAGLPERQRTAMALFYVADLPVREIALSMNISEGAVKAHLSHGRASVASRLAPTRTGGDDA